MINVILVDDHLIIGEAISQLLINHAKLDFLGYYFNATDAQNAFGQEPIDVVLLNISLPDRNGIEVCKWIKKKFPETKVLFFSMFFDELTIGRAMKAGGDGYLTKNEGFEEIFKAIEQVMTGSFFFSKEIEQILLKRPKHIYVNDIPILTTREIEVLNLIVKGYSSREIADKIYVSIKTIEFHRSNLLTKFDVKNAIELTSEAIKLGIVLL